jgi:hypothetical protein
MPPWSIAVPSYLVNEEEGTPVELFLDGVSGNAQVISDLFDAAGPGAGSADGAGS